jgi:catechol 2,3-dioxygenase
MANKKSLETINALPDTLMMGSVTLFVKDLAKLKLFYSEYMGLDILSEPLHSVELGYSNRKLITLVERKDLDFPQPGSAGLYHAAFLFSDRSLLSKTLLNLLNNLPDLYEGSGDHLVSQAFYFHDPEGNGVELYFDRPRNQWVWENGSIKMATYYIDVENFIKENMDKTNEETADIKIGHVHLKVGDIKQAKEFYADTLGFTVTAELPEHNPSALFVSAGGYHHHLGMNTWESLSADKRSDTLGMKSFEILLNSSQFFPELIDRLKKSKTEYKYMDSKIHLFDPWNNMLVIS